MTRLRQSFRRQRAPSTSSSSKKERPTQLEDADKPEQAEEEKKEEEGGEKKEGEVEKEEGEVEKEDEGGEGEKQEGDEPAAAVTVEAQVEEEISPAAAPEQEPEQPPEPNKEELPPVCKVKSESLENEILRAFGCAVTSMYRAASGKEAMDMLLRSGLIKQYLEQLKSFGEIEGVSATISVTRFHADIARYPGMVFRGFVYEGELTALSQKHDDVTYFPNVAQYKNIVQYKVKKFFDEQIKESLAEQGSYVIDVFVSTEKVYVIRLSPFYTGTGACLYTWAEDGKLLTNPPLDFKIIEAARKAPDLYSGLQSQWNSMLDSVLTQKQNENRANSGRQCTIL
ncbi:Cell division cycle protein 123 [Geodia barretti]|uniref:Cell division cycle protein 123 n=1 Tax=Geodia barretti TaxID=519541 RepID=A0AA35TNM8_GEOBA|nr:Cell division cycle protein 123 [Geodia barretti]